MYRNNKSLIYNLKYYLRNSHLHGLRYVGNEKYHITVRILWMIIFSASCFGMITMFTSLFNNYNENAISFLTETTYLDWNTSFPAVTLCQISEIDFNLTEDITGDQDPASLEFFLVDILFFTGTCYSCQTDCKSCSKINLAKVVNKLRKPCNKLLDTCQWNNFDFNCCEKFLPLETEYGVCFSLNSLHTTPSGKPDPIFMMNRENGPGKLVINTKEDIRVYYHAPEDVPFINSESNFRKDISVGDRYEVLIKVIEIENDENVKSLSIEKRECRFPWEVPDSLKVHKWYSYSTCMVQCHADNHIRLCNCTHHLMPVYNKQGYCDIDGLNCLTEHFETVNRIHAKGHDKAGLVCDCLPSCVEPEYTIVSDQKRADWEGNGITIKMQSLPTSRFKRVVVKSPLDLVVSIGGAAGLFIGASLITIVEFIYLILFNTKK
ncbi:sodium channel protein Nach-like [Sitophilus oryzae]|uniref:Sodium channel protein Nach-like n=1 Tax=Sitophilus oryzae TaxID=7048 RepID=A0A6J2YDX8_SITOR|nr:sodium channel protein Nach-like [Sitophilus oryzae]